MAGNSKIYDEGMAKELATQFANQLREENISKFRKIKESMKSNPKVQAFLAASKKYINELTPMSIILKNYRDDYTAIKGVSFVQWSQGKTWRKDLLFRDFGLPDEFSSRNFNYDLTAFIMVLYDEAFQSFSAELLVAEDSDTYSASLSVNDLENTIIQELFDYKVLKEDDVRPYDYLDSNCIERYFFRRFLSYGVWGVYKPYCKQDYNKISVDQTLYRFIVGAHFFDKKILLQKIEFENRNKSTWY